MLFFRLGVFFQQVFYQVMYGINIIHSLNQLLSSGLVSATSTHFK